MKETLIVLGCLGALAFALFQAFAAALHPLFAVLVATGGVR